MQRGFLLVVFTSLLLLLLLFLRVERSRMQGDKGSDRAAED
jgi:hypothetical protein